MEPVKCAQEELYQANQTNQMDLEQRVLATLKLVPDVFNTHSMEYAKPVLAKM